MSEPIIGGPQKRLIIAIVLGPNGPEIQVDSDLREVLWWMEQVKLQMITRPPVEQSSVVPAGGAIIPGIRG